MIASWQIRPETCHYRHLAVLMLLIWSFGLPVHARAQGPAAPEGNGAAAAMPQANLVTKNVLILHAFESNIPINREMGRGIMSVLESGGVGIGNQFFEFLALERVHAFDTLMAATEGALKEISHG